MADINPSGERRYVPDEMTAGQALERQYQFHRENSAAVWLSPEFRATEADKATDAFLAIGRLNHVALKVQP